MSGSKMNYSLEVFLSALFTGCTGTQLSTWSADLCPKFTVLDLKRQKRLFHKSRLNPALHLTVIAAHQD